MECVLRNFDEDKGCMSASVHLAIMDNNYHRLKLLIDAGMSINVRNHHNLTPLHLACRFGNISLVRMLIDEGASRGLKDAQGMTPGDHAKEKDCITIIGMLGKADKRGKECSNRINC